MDFGNTERSKSMSEYIKREDAIKAVNHLQEQFQLNANELEFGIMLKDVFRDVIPYADVKPVRHGQWIYGENEEGHDGYKCSECGKFIPWEYDKYDIDFIKEVHYCSNCGAKMDREEQEHEHTD